MTVQILQGDCIEVLRTLPADSVQCVVTSPPYFGLRDYGVDGQIGLVADRLQRACTLIELNPKYIALARKRIEGEAPLLAQVAA